MDNIFFDKPFFTNDYIVFGILTTIMALISYTSQIKKLSLFYKIIPTILLFYFIPSFLCTIGLIAPNWLDINGFVNFINTTNYPEIKKTDLIYIKKYIETNKISDSQYNNFIGKSNLYYIASRFLLPTSLILLTIGVDLKSIIKLGKKALIMFFVATIGIIIGGPISILIIKFINPNMLENLGLDNLWRGMTTIAGSWIGGSANQTAMKEVFNVSDKIFSVMVTVDIIVAEIWMAILLLSVGINNKINNFFKADSSLIESLKNTVKEFSKKNEKIITLNDLFVMFGITFGCVSLCHFLSNNIANYIQLNHPYLSKFSLTSSFFWLILLSTTFGLIFSFTKLKKLEGVGASKIGSYLIYILVATIGMKMDVTQIVKNFDIFIFGFIWMSIHAILLITVAYIIKAPFFYLAVGSKANIGGVASAPIIASAFDSSLASVGVLLAVLGYVLGTYGAYLCGILMSFI